MKKPSFWRLLGAYLIDFAITFFATWLMWKLFEACFPQALIGKNGASVFFCVLTMCAFIPNLSYFVWSEYLWEKTLGKRVLCIEVIEGNQRPSGKKLLKAYGIDFLLSIPASIVYSMMGLFLQSIIIFDRRFNTLDYCIMVGIVLSCLSMIVLYFSICESVWGKTLGKKLMDLQVVQASSANKTKFL